MSSRDRFIGKTAVYQCDDCGLKAESQPMRPPPALGVFGLPTGWRLGLSDCLDESPVYCDICAEHHETEADQ